MTDPSTAPTCSCGEPAILRVREAERVPVCFDCALACGLIVVTDIRIERDTSDPTGRMLSQTFVYEVRSDLHAVPLSDTHSPPAEEPDP